MLCALGEDVARPFGPAHVWAACFLNFVFYFLFFLSVLVFSTLNNLSIQKTNENKIIRILKENV
jgi:hypothetical protein